MLEKIITFAIICHFVMEAFVILGTVVLRYRLKRPIGLGITLNGLYGGLGLTVVATVLILFARWIGWEYLRHTLVILAVPYVLFAILLVSNSLDTKQIKKDAKEAENL